VLMVHHITKYYIIKTDTVATRLGRDSDRITIRRIVTIVTTYLFHRENKNEDARQCEYMIYFVGIFYLFLRLNIISYIYNIDT